MICPQFKPIVGGYERAAERLSVALVAMGHTVTVISENRNFAWKAKEECDGVRIRRLWCLYKAHLHRVTSLASFALFLLTQGRKFQVWHIHQYGLHAPLAVALGKLLHRPVVLKLANSGKEGLQNVISALPMARLAKFLLKKVNAVIALTRETQVEAREFGIPDFRVYLLGNGVDTHSFKPRSEEERICSRKKVGFMATGIVLFAGRLVEQKNVKGLLLSWKMALTNLPEGWKLVLLGEGLMREQLEAFSQSKGMEASVIFAGRSSNVETWMAAADIFVLPSHYEGLSNTMLEAMATGLPVVSTRVSGSAEVLEETCAGLVVDIGQMEQFSDALVRLALDPVLRSRMGEVGRATIEKNYAIEQVAGRHEVLYRKVIEGN